MSSRKCARCGFVGWGGGAACKGCSAAWVAADAATVQAATEATRAETQWVWFKRVAAMLLLVLIAVVIKQNFFTVPPRPQRMPGNKPGDEQNVKLLARLDEMDELEARGDLPSINKLIDYLVYDPALASSIRRSMSESDKAAMWRSMTHYALVNTPYYLPSEPRTVDHTDVAFQHLAVIGEPAVLPLMAASQTHPQLAARLSSIRLLGRLRSPKSVPTLLALMHSPDETVREAAYKAAVELPDERFIADIEAMFVPMMASTEVEISWGDDKPRKLAANSLYAMKTPRAKQVFADLKAKCDAARGTTATKCYYEFDSPEQRRLGLR